MDRDEGADRFDFLSEEIPGERHPARSRRVLAAGLALLAIIVVAAVAVPSLLIGERREVLERDLATRLRILAEGRAQNLETWLEGKGLLAGRIADSDLFRLFATEMAMAGGDMSEAAGAEAPGGPDDPLATQLPYMEVLLSDFARETGFLGAIVVGPGGGAYIRGGGAGELSAAQAGEAAKVFTQGSIHYGPVRAAAAGLAMDLYVPIFPIQADPGEGPPAAVLLLTAPVAAKLSEILAPHALSEPGERLTMIQKGPDGFSEITPGAARPIRPLAAAGPFDSSGGIAFGRRAALGAGAGEGDGAGGDAGGDAGGEVYAAGIPVTGTAWWMVQERDVAAARVALDGFARAAAAVAVLLVLTVIAALTAFWWRMEESHSRALARQFRDLASWIEGQRRLLDSINGTVADYIGLKNPDGGYRYVNAAFAKAAGRPAAQMTGLDDAAIFGRGTAGVLEASDRQALDQGRSTTSAHEVYLGDRQRHLQISKVPLLNEAGAATGVVSVARDVTDLVEEQRRKQRTVQQMVDALVRAVELRDPYLAGHSKRVAAFASETARRLGAGADETATLEIAANLSQIGKLAIPRALLNKKERLNAAEIARMQSHVGDAVTTLEGIDFELPVLDTIRQMHERLDGTGYPEGLTGDQISQCGRILAACDVFCARVEPRSYRAGIAPEAALEILAQHPERYDAEAVAALSAALGSVAGAKLIAGI